jgi:hypothetical protein
MPERSQWDVHKYVPPHLIFNTFLLLARWSAKFHQNVKGCAENSGEQGSKYIAQSVSEDWFLQVGHISSLSFGIPTPGLRRLEAHVLAGWPRFNSRSFRVWGGGGFYCTGGTSTPFPRSTLDFRWYSLHLNMLSGVWMLPQQSAVSGHFPHPQ